MPRLWAVCTTHRRTAVATLERFPRGDQVPGVLTRLRDRPHVAGALVLSTCNRYETYLTTDLEPTRAELVELVAWSTGVAATLVKSSADIYAGDDAVRHLFAVAAGLDSRALGEGEILGQLRVAIRTATEEGGLDAELRTLTQWALRAGRRARRTDAPGPARGSVGDHGTRLLQRHLGGLEGRSVLVVGAGRVAAQVVRAARDAGGRVVVVGRDPARAVERVPVREVAPLSTLPDHLLAVDAVVCATSARSAVLTRDLLTSTMHRREGNPLLVLDLAVPRNVEPVPGPVPGLVVLDLDALPGHHPVRGLRAAEESVATETASYVSGAAARRASALLGNVTARAEELRRHELERVRARGSDAELALLDEVTRRLVGKLLHPALVGIRDLAADGELAQASLAAALLAGRSG